MKKAVIPGFFIVLTIFFVAILMLSSGSVPEGQIAIRLRLGQVIDSIDGPSRYFAVPFVDHVHFLQKHQTSTIFVSKNKIVMNVEITDPKDFFLAYSGSYLTLIKEAEKRIGADSVLQAKLLANSDVPYRMPGVSMKLRKLNE